MSSSEVPNNDHDLLIRLSANFESFTKQYQLDMRELKDGTTRQISDHEIRLQKLEKNYDVAQPEEKAKRLLVAETEIAAVKQEIRDFITTAKTARWFIGIITAIMGSVVTLFGNYIFRLLGIVQ